MTAIYANVGIRRRHDIGLLSGGLREREKFAGLAAADAEVERVVCRKEYESIRRKTLSHLADVAVESDRTLYAAVRIVCVEITFDHQKESLRISGKDLNRFVGCFTEVEIGAVPQDDGPASVVWHGCQCIEQRQARGGRGWRASRDRFRAMIR